MLQVNQICCTKELLKGLQVSFASKIHPSLSASHLKVHLTVTIEFAGKFQCFIDSE